MDVFGVGSAVQGGAALAGAGLQYKAASDATNAQREAATNSLNFQKNVYDTQQQQQSPYYNWGTQGAGQLAAGTINDVSKGQFTAPVNYGGQSFDMSGYAPIWGDQGLNQNPQLQPDFQFTGQDLQNDPGYQFQLDQGLQAQQRSAAATGATGGAAAKAIAQYTTGLANTTFNDAYGRALSTRNTNSQQQNTNFGQYLAQNQNLQSQNQQLFGNQLAAYQANQQNQMNIYNAGQQNQANAFNRYATLAGIGQNAAAGLGAAGNQAAQGYANTTAQLGNSLAAGSIAGGNAITSGINGAANAFNNYWTQRNSG